MGYNPANNAGMNKEDILVMIIDVVKQWRYTHK